MNSEKWIAHKTDDGRIQTVKEHLDGTAQFCQEFADGFDASKIGKITGQLHDIGKYSEAFQKHISGSTISVDHSTAGAYESIQTRNVISAFCIMGHHTGLPDLGGKSDIGGSTFLGRIYKAKNGDIEPYSAWREENYIEKINQTDLPKVDDAQQAAFFIRMMYSCLVDADFLDTERFMQNESRTRDYDSIDKLISELSKITSNWKNPVSELNRIRTEILDTCINEGIKTTPGLFSLTVPTGGGKTTASMAFALHHAQQNGLKRIIYVIPYTSIIEQTAETFRKLLGERNVLEHHSGVTYDDGELKQNPDLEKLKLASENWDIPVTVTTSVQFFESIYSNKPSKCRKIHNLSESIIIFDEAQMIPLCHLKPCLNAIAQLVLRYKVSAILCTATQPALDTEFMKIIPRHPIKVKEICPRALYDQEVFKRVQYKNIGLKSWNELAGILEGKEQALCIVNNRKSAHTLYQLLSEEEGSNESLFHLTTLMYPEHRRSTLNLIRERLKKHLPCKVIATSLIEAGVDIDFQYVFRELSGLDSILQAAGRCNREGKRKREDSTVFIFKSEARIPVILETPVCATEEVIRGYDQIDSPEAIHDYFKILRHYLSSEEAQDKYGIMKGEPKAYKQISKKFRMIDNDTYVVYIPFGQGKELIQRYHFGEKSRSIIRHLGQYGVPVYREQLKKLLESGAVTPLDDIDTGNYVLLNTNLYSDKQGLSLDVDYGNAFFI